MAANSSAEEVLRLAKRVSPTGSRLFCRVTKDARRIGLIWAPDGGKSLDIVASQVIARGPDVKAKKWELGVGDWVLHVRTAGVKYDGSLGVLSKGAALGEKNADFLFLFEADVLAVADPDTIGKIEGSAQYSEGRTGTWTQGQS